MNAQSTRILFFKANPHHGPDGRFAPVSGASGATPLSSAEITTIQQARAYWRAHFANKTLALNVHSANPDNEKNKPIPIKVRFSDTSHAYTGDSGGRHNKTGKRIFDEKRAKALDRLIPTIEHPKQRIRNFDADLLLEGRINHEYYTVVLKWRAALEVYEFTSTHFKPVHEVDDLIRHQSRRNNEGPLRKASLCCGSASPPPRSPVLEASFECRISPPGVTTDLSEDSVGSGRTEQSLPSIADLFKACPPLQQAHTLLLWRDDEPAVAALSAS